ncbi:MAG: hypothetical protein ACRC8S_05135 [Fimbriiglobus sp.]
MPIAIDCPNCGVAMKAPDHAAGKRVKCPKCGTAIPIPSPEDEFEVIEEAPKPAKKAVKLKPVSTKPIQRDDDDDDDDEPRAKKRLDDDEEEEDRPRKRTKASKKSKKSGGFPMWIPIAGGGVLVLAVVVVGLALLLSGPPAGYTKINDAGIRIYLHGKVTGTFIKHNGVISPNLYLVSSDDRDNLDHKCTLYAQRKPDTKPIPATKSNLRDAYSNAFFVQQFLNHTVVSEEDITVGGQPGTMMIIKELPDVWEKDEQQKEFFKERNDRVRARHAREGKVSAFIYVVNGDWAYYISVTNTLKDIDPAKLKIILDSVRF